MVDDPSIAKVADDLEDEELVAGCKNGQWRILSFIYPKLDFVVSAVEPDGSGSEYGFRADLMNFPSDAPMVRIWDHVNDRLLPAVKRPKGGPRLVGAFKDWSSHTVYRPWDRMTGPHNNNARTKPHLGWNPNRRLLFIFEDLHGLLTSNARATRDRKVA
tara:strand:- start:138 stop:614 length:477 start_codon:yes stop_codon:yes gene_type:complete